MKILALSGSLRNASKNTMLLRAIARIAKPDIEVVIYQRLAELPLFNTDLENPLPEIIASLRDQIIAADAVIIASPEYAHGISGVIKNALDWMVGNEALVYKPLALLNTSPRATHAQAALRETLSVMSALIIEEASITIPLPGSDLTEEFIIKQPYFHILIDEALMAIQGKVLVIKSQKENQA